MNGGIWRPQELKTPIVWGVEGDGPCMETCLALPLSVGPTKNPGRAGVLVSKRKTYEYKYVLVRGRVLVLLRPGSRLLSMRQKAHPMVCPAALVPPVVPVLVLNLVGCLVGCLVGGFGCQLVRWPSGLLPTASSSTGETYIVHQRCRPRLAGEVTPVLDQPCFVGTQNVKRLPRLGKRASHETWRRGKAGWQAIMCHVERPVTGRGVAAPWRHWG